MASLTTLNTQRYPMGMTAQNDFRAAYQNASRVAMYDGMRRSPDAPLIPFVRFLYSRAGGLVADRAQGYLKYMGKEVWNTCGFRQGCGWGMDGLKHVLHPALGFGRADG